MEILEVELENIKSFAQARISFRAGVNAIVGHNGAGKSTILEAIGFALFDFLGYKAADFLREGARAGSVAVTFVSGYDERPYRVERRLGGSHLYVVYDCELQAKICEGKIDVLAFVRRHTGADPEADLAKLFADAIGVPQGSLTAIFLQTAAGRKSAFDVLLQVDEYQRAVDLLREPQKLLRERQQTLAQESATYAARLERLPPLQAAVAERTRELAATRARQTDMADRLRTVEEQKGALEAARATLDALALQEVRLAEQAQQLATQVETSVRALAEAQAARQLVAANEAGYQSYMLAQARKVELDNQTRTRQRLLGERATADRALALLDADSARAAAALQEISAAEVTVLALAGAVARQGQLEAALATAQQAVQRLATLGQQRARQEQRLADLQLRSHPLVAALDHAEALAAALAIGEQESTHLRAQIDEHKNELAVWKTQADAINKQTGDLEDVATTHCPLCEQPLTAEHRERMLERNRALLQRLREQYGAAQNTLRTTEKTLKAHEAETVAKRQQLLTMPRAAQLQELERDLAAAEQELAVLRSEEATLAPASQQAGDLTATLVALDNPRQRSAIAAAQAAQRTSVEAQRVHFEQRRQAAQTQMNVLAETLVAFAELDEALSTVQAELTTHEPSYQTVLAQRQLAASVAPRETALAQQRGQWQETTAALAQVQRAAATARSQFDAVEYATILAEERTLRGAFGSLQAQLELLAREQQREEAEIEVLHHEQTRLDAVQAQQRAFDSQVGALDTIRTLLRQAGPYITQAVIRQISAGAAQIFGEIMQDFSRRLLWGEDYGITLEVDGATRQFAQLSGGEQMSAALAVRLALVREMSKLDIAFFDEPTANLDDVRREALAQQIMNIRGFRQLFVISHDDTFEQATQNLIRVRRHGATSIIIPDESL